VCVCVCVCVCVWISARRRAARRKLKQLKGTCNYNDDLDLDDENEDELGACYLACLFCDLYCVVKRKKSKRNCSNKSDIGFSGRDYCAVQYTCSAGSGDDLFTKVGCLYLLSFQFLPSLPYFLLPLFFFPLFTLFPVSSTAGSVGDRPPNTLWYILSWKLCLWWVTSETKSTFVWLSL